MLEVVVVAIGLVKDVDDDRSIVNGNPRATGHTLDTKGLESHVESHKALDLIDDGPDVAIVSARGDNERVESVDEGMHVEHDRVNSDLLLGRVESCFDDPRGFFIKARDRCRSSRSLLVQLTTPTTKMATAKGTAIITKPIAIHFCRDRRRS